MIDLGDAGELDGLIQTFRELAARGVDRLGFDFNEEPEQPDNSLTLTQQLYQKLIQPIQGYLTTENLILATDGTLNLLPFSGLMDDQGQLFGQRHTIRYLNSGRELLREDLHSKRSSSAPLILADPDYNLDGTTPTATDPKLLAKLGLATLDNDKPFSRAAGTDYLGTALGKKLRVAPYLRENALVSHLKNNPSPKVLVLATHGFHEELPTADDYQQLIINLLLCPQGQELEILQRNSNLCQSPLLKAAQNIQQQLDRNSEYKKLANFLRDFTPVLTEIVQNIEQNTHTDQTRQIFQNEDPMSRSGWPSPELMPGLKGKTSPQKPVTDYYSPKTW
ncbi:MAG: CHAT domain-containing protein [Synechococcaceae cyanobacterium RL_1_2]|nr:CHAT domain-containing protein [Synechococcaceae cyanobacterium RL_1_2]